MTTATYTPESSTRPGRSVLTGISLAGAIAAVALSIVAIATDDVAQPAVATTVTDAPTSKVEAIAPVAAVPAIAGDPEQCEPARIGFVDRC